jgi:anion-transporting  ArsA/GET3 family ATPase
VLVLEVDPRENLHQMLDLPPSGGEIAPAGGGVFLQNLKPRQVLDRVVAERLKIDALARRVLSSPVYQNFAEGAPGLKEVAVLGHALRLVRGLDPAVRGEPFDLVILDAPATGHGVSLLTAPLLISEVIQEGPFGRMGGELAEFVADPSLCGVVVVTSGEEMPVQEALELEARLQERLGRGAELMVVNGVYPPLPVGADTGGEDAALDLWAHRRRLQEREMARLAASWDGPLVELPKLPLPSGPQLVSQLVRCLDRGLEGLEEG